MGPTMAPFLSDQARAALGRLSRGDAAAEPPDPLERLRDIRALELHLASEPAVLASVRDALERGAGWAEVAEAAQLGTAAAKWRWQGTDEEIAARQDAGRKRSARPSSVPTDLPGLSVADAAARLGVSAQAVYLRISRGTLQARTIELSDGRKYKRVLFDGEGGDAAGGATPGA